MERLGLFGGSFDPVHLGHLLVAQAALEELALARLYFILAARSPFKPGGEPAPAEARARLLRLALAGRSDCELDLQEVQRGGVSYTIESVRRYAQRVPAAQLFYLIGADHVSQLPQWREASELARLVEFVVIPRPGEARREPPPPFRSVQLEGVPLGVSSSQVRQRVRQGRSIDLLAPPAVVEAIHNNGLYL